MWLGSHFQGHQAALVGCSRRHITYLDALYATAQSHGAGASCGGLPQSLLILFIIIIITVPQSGWYYKAESVGIDRAWELYTDQMCLLSPTQRRLKTEQSFACYTAGAARRETGHHVSLYIADVARA